MQIPNDKVYQTKEESIAGWQAWKNGDKKAYEKLQYTASKLAINAAQEALARFRRKHGDDVAPGETEDAVSEAVVEALGALNRWDPAQGHLSTLIIPTAEGAVANWLGKESNRGMGSRWEPYAVDMVSLDAMVEELGEAFDLDSLQSSYGPDVYPSPEEILIAEEEAAARRGALHAALSEVTDEERSLLCRVHGIGRPAETHSAIATSLGVARQSLSERLSRIHGKMRKGMEAALPND